MNQNTQLQVASQVLAITAIAGAVALLYKPSPRTGGESERSFTDWIRDHYKPIVAGGMAYAYYVSAALLAGAEFPKFLRDHLFDGLVPAFLVGLLVDLYPRTNAATAFPNLRRPVMVLFVLFIPGAVIFGLIATAATFSSGKSNYQLPITVVALIGGFIVPNAYITDVIESKDTFRGATRWERIKWWFKKRPKSKTSPADTDRPESHQIPTAGEPGPLLPKPGPAPPREAGPPSSGLQAATSADGAPTEVWRRAGTTWAEAHLALRARWC